MNILITGASSGLGKALAISYANTENTLVLLGRNEANLHSTQVICESTGASVRCFIGDVTSPHFEELMQTIAHNFSFDLVFANAGMSLLETFEQDPVSKIDPIKMIMGTNFLGPIKTIFPLLPGLKEKNGRIVVISSLAAQIGLPQDPAYSASKAALIRFFEGVRPIFKKQGVSTTIVLPGFIDTPLSQKINDPKPFCLSVDKAALKIKQGIKKNKYIIAFPKSLQLLMALRHLVPRKMLDFVLRALA